MTKRNAVFAGLFLAVTLAGLWLVFSQVESFRNARRLKSALTALPEGSTTLEQAIPFDWEAVYSFAPYTSREEIARTIGFDSPEISETMGEGMTQLIFVEDERVVLCICAYPENLGYDVDFAGCVRYGEHTRFAVRQGDVVRLAPEPA